MLLNDYQPRNPLSRGQVNCVDSLDLASTQLKQLNSKSHTDTEAMLLQWLVCDNRTLCEDREDRESIRVESVDLRWFASTILHTLRRSQLNKHNSCAWSVKWFDQVKMHTGLSQVDTLLFWSLATWAGIVCGNSVYVNAMWVFSILMCCIGIPYISMFALTDVT